MYVQLCIVTDVKISSPRNLNQVLSLTREVANKCCRLQTLDVSSYNTDCLLTHRHYVLFSCSLKGTTQAPLEPRSQLH